MLNEMYPFFYLFIVSQGFFFFLLILAAPHGRPLAKKLLLAFIIIQIVSPWLNYLSGSSNPLYQAVRFLGDLNYLSGPVLYFYIAALRRPGFRFGWRQILHFVPPLLLGLALRIGLELLPQESGLYAEGLWTLRTLALVSWFFGYLVASLQLLPGNSWSFREWMVSREDAIWRWLSAPILFYIGVYLLQISVQLLRLSDVISIERGGYLVLAMSCRIIFFYLVAIGAYRHRYFYETQEEQVPDDDVQALAVDIEPEEKMELEVKVKYASSSMSEERLNAIWQQLNDYMHDKEPFTESALKLSGLAQALTVPANSLSQVINSHTQQNFHDFINGYRARKAQTLIESNADTKQPLLELSMEAGFGNTGTFYKYFKKHYGLTPAQYRRSCQAR